MKRVLDDDENNEEQIENTPLLKRKSPLINENNFQPIISQQPSVIDDDELDFL